MEVMLSKPEVKTVTDHYGAIQIEAKAMVGSCLVYLADLLYAMKPMLSEIIGKLATKRYPGLRPGDVVTVTVLRQGEDVDAK